MKVCKIAGAGVAQGTPFTFDVSVDTVDGLFAPFTTPVTVQAGPAAQGGFCQFVDGPYAPTLNGFGTFNQGSTVTVTERAVPGTVVTSTVANSGGTSDPANRTATFNIIPQVTEVAFTNAAGPVPPVGPAAFDFDGDGKADPAVFRASEGNWYVLGSRDGFFVRHLGVAGDIPASSDFDGDGIWDPAVMRSNMWHILRSSDNTRISRDFGLLGDIPTAGRWDSDHMADLSVYRPGTNGGNGTFFYLGTTNNPETTSYVPIGLAGDIPVNGDFDGDRKMDAAVYRPSNGGWYIYQSSNSQWRILQFGISTDLPVPADYDGDGTTDLAVYRNGEWHLLASRDGVYSAAVFGNSTDIPTPADYDGDGRADRAVYRGGIWHVDESTGGYKSFQFGLSSDNPITGRQNQR